MWKEEKERKREMNLGNDKPSKQCQHLGDGVYADFDGYHIILTANDPRDETRRVYLEPQVIEALNHYIKRVKER
jgi:hypothetical protein